MWPNGNKREKQPDGRKSAAGSGKSWLSLSKGDGEGEFGGSFDRGSDDDEYIEKRKAAWNNNGINYTKCNTQDDELHSDISKTHTSRDFFYGNSAKTNEQCSADAECDALNDINNTQCLHGKLSLKNGANGIVSDTKSNNRDKHVSFRIRGTKDKNKKMKMKEYEKSKPWPYLLREFTQDTTLHGIRFITLDTRFILRRILWALLVLVTIGIFVFYVCNRVNEFLKFKKSISVEENYVSFMKFPSVTICNQNRVRLTAAAEKGWYDAVSKLYKQTGEQEMRKCLSHEFTCEASRLCIPNERHCDAYPDCADASDETDCDVCPRLTITGTEEFGNVTFLLQHMEMIPNPVYAANMQDEQLYFYFDPDEYKWILTPMFNLEPVDDKLTGMGSSLPIGVIKSAMTGKTYTIECTPLQMEELKDPNLPDRQQNEKKAQHISMSELYQAGKHEKDVFIESCQWKGNDCNLRANFKETITDLGVCYTFHNEDMNVEASGPGNGLTLYLNIEQYEYTKDAGRGVGVKVLIHDEGNMAMLDEAGIAISPGLYSLLAMEKTEITNLKSPWGNCSEWPLDYFDHYSMSTCKMDCDNHFAREQCNCRGPDMPKKLDEDTPVCTIDQFTNCLMPKMSKAKTTKNYCKCKMPCKEAAYVPSLSFASISVDEDTIKSRRQEARMAALENKLTKAREIIYRLADDKYRETLRVLSILNFRANDIVSFLSATEGILQNEKITVINSFNFINKDCQYLLNTSRTLENLVRTSLMPSMQKFQSLLQILEFQLGDYSSVQEMEVLTLTDNERSFIEELSSLKQFVYIKPLTVNFSYHEEYENETRNATLTVTLPDFDVQSNVSNYQFDSYAYYIMLRSRLLTVLNSVDMASEKLVNDVNKTFENFPSSVKVDLGGVQKEESFEETKEELLGYSREVYKQLQQIRMDSERAFTLRIKELAQNKRSKGARLHTQLKPILDLTNRTIFVTVSEAVSEYQDLGNLLSPKCEYESNNLKTAFYEAQDQVITRMTDMREEANAFIDILSNATESYILSELSLNYVAGNLDLIDLRNSFNAYQLAIENLINQKVVTVKRLISHGKSLKDLSSGIGSKNSTNVSESKMDFGTDVIEAAHNNMHRLGSHVTILQDALNNAHSYLRGYADGNVLNEDFFKKNYLQLDLFYKTLTDKKVTQQKAYEYQALLSEVGGLMGLLLGASLITIFELLDVLLYNAFVKCCDRRLQQKKATYETSKEAVPANNHTALSMDQHALRRKRLVPLASMDPMEGLDYENTYGVK